jgi:16S rRNA processing protein RimM
VDIKDCYKFGFVLKPHGLKGEVTISIDPNVPNSIDGIESVFLSINDTLVPYFVAAVSVRGDKAFVKFEDVDSAEHAKDISKRAIYIPKSARPKSTKGEFYDDEIPGYMVTDENKGELGKVQEVMAAGPNKLLVLDWHGKEVLIPVNSPFILSINKSKKKITVNLPDGFLDI